MSGEHQLEQLDLQGGWIQIPIERDELQPYVTTATQREAISLPARRVTCINESRYLEKIAANPKSAATVVNALLAYSRGQLSVAPCAACAQRYEDDGSALPFPDCVFLPGKWGFACASCIARRDAVECSLSIPRQECLDLAWECVGDLKEVDEEASQWLDRGHPLRAPECLWMLRSEIDGHREHDLTHPGQLPSFVHPSETPGVRLPGVQLPGVQLPGRTVAATSVTPSRSPSTRIAARKKVIENAEKRRLRLEARKRRLAVRKSLPGRATP